MTREQIIEAMARAACQNMLERHGACYDTCEITGKCCGEDIDLPGTAAALTALETAIPGLADVIAGTKVIVPVERTGMGEILREQASRDVFPRPSRAMIEAGKAGE